MAADRTSLYEALIKLLPSQFEEVLMRAGVPTQHLGGAAAAQAGRAGEVMRHVDQRGAEGERALAAALDKVAPGLLDRLGRFKEPDPTPAQERTTMAYTKLKGKERKTLAAALLSAFPGEGEVKRVVRYAIDEHYDHIASGDTYPDRIDSVITSLDAASKIPALLAEAREKNPGNPELASFDAEYRRAR